MYMRRLKKVATVILLFVTLFSIGCAAQTTSTSAPALSQTSTPATTASSQSPAARKTYSTSPAMQLDPAKKYTATVDTSLGTFKIQLLASESPIAVNNFVFLSKQGFYNGIIFHRIIQNFMIQTGDPLGTGAGGPGYKFADELPPKHKYDPGIVAMANSGANTNGSQFFICTGADAHGLDSPPYNLYTQFGQVSEGMDVVQKIAAVPVRISAQGETSQPINPPVIKTITITEQ
jgi:cyclophilin family peptidyl-prolyl cis-trans isomerase